jgi:hypothetical protein
MVVPLLSMSLVAVLVTKVSPFSLGPLGVLILLALVYLTITFVSGLVVIGFLAAIRQFGLIKRPPLRNRRVYYIVSILSLAPVFLLALNSLGQLEFRDFVLVFLFTGLTCFYSMRRIQANR